VLSVDKGVIEASGLCHHGQLDRSYQLDAEGETSSLCNKLSQMDLWKERSLDGVCGKLRVTC
jgi:hypothetical protein